MLTSTRIPQLGFRAYQRKDIDAIPQLERLAPEELLAMKTVSAVLPFRVNNYVVEQLIRWDRIPEDPLYQLTFPQRGMLAPADFDAMADLIRSDAPETERSRSSASPSVWTSVSTSGAVVRCQAPLIRRVNDSARTWADMWRLQVQLGAVPYYMFVERDTGPKNYFDVPLARASEIFQEAYRLVSGLARTVRGPSMSATPGKVMVVGTAEVQGEKVFVLTLEQGRDPSWVGRPFFARFDAEATWLDQLRPAFGEEEFFFDPAMREIEAGGRQRPWGETVPPRRTPVLFGHVEWH